MREVVTMWRDSRMIILTIVVTAAYTAVLIPFKGLVVIPGITEIRPANAFPVVFSLLFGPAAAWGSAFGNLLGDVFGGTLTGGSIFGFVGNFFYGFAGYKVWGNLGRLSSGDEPRMQTGSQLLEFLVVALVAAAGTAAIIAWGLEVLGLVPFAELGLVIAGNNFVTSAILGPVLLRVLYPRIERDGLLYPDLMQSDALPDVSPARQRRAGTAIAAIALAWLVAGVVISVSLHGVPFGTDAGGVDTPGATESGAETLVGAVGFGCLLLASLFSGERLSRIRGRGQRRPRSEDDEAVAERVESGRS